MALMTCMCCCVPTSPDLPLPGWNKIIKKQVLSGNPKRAILTFKHMHECTTQLSADNFTYPLLLKAVSALSLPTLGSALHAQILKSGFHAHPFVQTSLLNMYSSFQSIGESRKVFDQIFDKDVVAWNSMLAAYVSCSQMDSALQLFDNMPNKDFRSYNIMIYGYACIGRMSCARTIFDKIPETERDTVTWNSMVLACLNFGDLEEGRKLFEKMPQRSVVSWNTLLAGYLRNGHADEILVLFERMKEEKFEPDHLTVSTLLSASAHLGLLDKGREIHIYAQTLGLTSNVRVTTSLIDMYAKCGCLNSSLKVFYKSQVKDIYCWNAIISGLAIHGHGIAALKLFEKMEEHNKTIPPDDVTFIGLLAACSHAGLVEEGQRLFDYMEKDYGVTPKSEHYGCMVDLLGRAGFLEQAFQIIESMPFKPGKSVLGALLSSCVHNMDLMIGEKVVKKLSDSCEGLNDGDYMMISNLYASCKQWDEANRWREMMNNSGISKPAGRSGIEVDGRVYNFLAGNRTTNENSLS